MSKVPIAYTSLKHRDDIQRHLEESGAERKGSRLNMTSAICGRGALGHHAETEQISEGGQPVSCSNLGASIVAEELGR